jgi:uncharacterized caspase-like protein
MAGVLSVAALPSAQAQTESVHLLAIGVKKYEAFNSLPNPGIDAELVARAFRKVTTVKQVSARLIMDGTRDEVFQAADYGRRVSGRGSIIMFFAGHGVQVEGRSYLVPPDCTYWSTVDDVKREGIDVGKLIEAYSMAAGSSFMLFLDACRNNPFTDAAWASEGRGLSAPVAEDASTGAANEWVLPKNVAVSYSTQPGMVASDGPIGQHSDYARAFASILENNFSITYRTLVDELSRRVVEASKGEQVPWFTANLDIDRPILS